MKTRISSKGQVVIPKAYRQKLGWEAGTELIVEEEAGQVLLKSRATKKKGQPLSAIIGILHRPGMKSSSIEEMDTSVAESFKNWEV